MPVEIAIHRYDQVIFLLAGLGASLSIGTQQSYQRTWNKGASLLDAVEELIKKLDEDLGNPKQTTGLECMEVDNADQPEWKAWLIKSNEAIKVFGEKGNKKQQDNELINERNRMKDYLWEVRVLLKEKKAKTWDELHPDAEKKEKRRADKQQIRVIPFQVWASNWYASAVSQEKVPLYEELYQACWNGDDDKIRELCLPPPEGTTRKVAPLQIVCKTTEGGEPALIRCFHLTLTHRLQNSLHCMLRSIVVTGRQRTLS